VGSAAAGTGIPAPEPEKTFWFRPPASQVTFYESVATEDDEMKIRTRDFGVIEIEDTSEITFVSPILGFENQSRFVFLNDDSIGSHFAFLQSLEEPELCFILADPHAVVADYLPELPAAFEKQIGEEDCMCWLLVVLKDTLENSTVNLKSPIVVNPSRRIAGQVVLEGDWPVRYPLVGGKGVR
jgi:flagellar assembly factor FliW